jgi:Putative DNA-binding domain
MNLAELQHTMGAWLSGDELAVSRFEVKARAGLDVYRNNYRAQLVACLSDTFARVKAWIGDEAFLSCAATYIDAVPPNDWTLDKYGHDFPQTLQKVYPTDAEVSELAWLDRAMADAFVAADAEPVTATSLADVDWADARFELTPSLRLGTATTNSTALWSALSENGAPPLLERLPQSISVLVWRKGWNSCLRTLDDYESRSLQAALAGASFGEICATSVTALGEQEGVRAAGGHLARWLQDGLIVRLEN